MKKVLAIALVGLLLAGSANAAMLSLRDGTPGAHQGSLSPAADPMVLNISETGVIEVVLELWQYSAQYPSYAEEVIGVNLFLDSVQELPLGDPEAEDMEVVNVTVDTDADFVWTGSRAYAVAPMGLFEPPAALPLPFGSGITLDEYYLVANMAPGEALEGVPNAGSNEYIIDSIVVHGISESTDTVWFENETTFQPAFPGGTLRNQSVFKPDNTTLTVSGDTGAASSNKLGFYNAYIKSGKGAFAREGYWVNVVPEPASLALLALGGVAVLRRRK